MSAPLFRPWTHADPLDAIAEQKLAVALLEWACRGSAGVGEKDDRYRLVTEGRDTGPKWSGCGALAHWELWSMGIRLGWVNRAGNGYRDGQNVSLLCWNGLARTVALGSRFEPGDIVVQWNRADGTDAHVMCVVSHDGTTLLTAEYGQEGSADRPELAGKLKEHRILERDGKPYVGARRLQRYLSLIDVLRRARAQSLLLEAIEPLPEPSEPLPEPKPAA